MTKTASRALWAWPCLCPAVSLAGEVDRAGLSACLQP
jgi:hypothetical protein